VELEMQSWDSEGLWKKAKLFMDSANDHDLASSEFAFFAALALECLARSALTKVHPVLNADPRDDANVLYACGYSFAKPRSLPAHSVYLRRQVKLTGTRFKELPEQYSDGDLYMDVEYLPTSFQCKACELSLGSIEEIAHAGLPTHFTKVESTSLHDLYEPEHYQEYDNM
jgi:hypothetical protein